MLCGMIMLSSIVQARPNQQVPQLTPQVSTYYHIMEKRLSIKENSIAFFLRSPKIRLRQQCCIVLMEMHNFLIVNEALAQAKKPLPVIASLGYVGEKAYFIAERTHDYTPRVHGEAFAKGGNVEQFYQFMVSQLKTLCALAQAAQENITITEQSLFGHSFGGVFTLYVLFNHPDAFQRYIAASPSLWWGKGEWITQDKWQQIPNNVAVTITLGELEETPDFFSNERRATLALSNA